MANTFELISAVTVGSGGASSIDFTSIPSTYTDLAIVASIRNGNSAAGANCYMRFNGDTGNNYSFRILYGLGSGTPGSTNSTAEGITDRNWVGYLDTQSQTANTFANMSIYIPNYAGSTFKSISSDSVTEDNATGSYATLHANLWSSTSAITSIKLFPNTNSFVQYSTAYLYGVKNA